jgi:hypothetical protein
MVGEGEKRAPGNVVPGFAGGGQQCEKSGAG